MATESFKANPEIVLRTEEDGAFLFDPDSGRICFVNEVGISIWKLCEDPASLADIILQVDKLGFLVPGTNQTEGD